MGWTVKNVVAAIVWMMNYVILSVDIVLMVAMMGILEHGVTHVINNNTSFVVMYFFWNVIYWLWLKSCGLSCDNVFKNLFLSTETVVNSVHNIHADKFNTKKYYSKYSRFECNKT